MEQEHIQGLPEMWAVLELFGHQQVAGKLSVQNLGAACLIRMDVPECTRRINTYNHETHDYADADLTTPAHARFFGVGAIYAINPCSEDTARELLKKIGNPPVQQYELNRMKLLAAPPAEAVDATMEQICLCGHARKMHTDDAGCTYIESEEGGECACEIFEEEE